MLRKVIGNFRENRRAARAIGAAQYDVAIDIYTRRIEADETDSDALLMIAHCYEWNNDIESALQYANRRIAQNPKDFEMLLLAARCWSEKDNEEQTYNYVCRAIENVPFSEPEDLPQIFYVVMKWLSVFKKFRGIDVTAREGMQKYKKAHKENIAWAWNYKQWHEAKNGVNPSSIETN